MSPSSAVSIKDLPYFKSVFTDQAEKITGENLGVQGKFLTIKNKKEDYVWNFCCVC
jgi:hypothetical protein